MNTVAPNSQSRSQKKKILFLNRGDSSYDEMFLRSFTSSFEVTCGSFNPRPSMNFSSSKFVSLRSPLMFLYNYPRARFLIYSLGHRQIRNILKAEKPDLLVCSYSSTYGFMCAKSDFHPFVLITFGSDILLEPKRYLLGNRVKFALSKADLIFVDSAETQSIVLNSGVDRKRVVSFPRFDPISVCQVKQGTGFSARSSYKLENKKKIVLHTRWFEPVYNVPTVIRGFALARQKIPDSVLVLVGNGSLENEARDLVKKLHLEDSVYFTGKLRRDQVIPLYDEADVYVSACISDSNSGSLLEAICRGAPVVVSDSQTNREWIEDKISGTLFNPLSPEELAGKIVEVLTDPGKYKEMATRARSTVLSKIDWQRNEQMFMQKMLELVSDRKQ